MTTARHVPQQAEHPLRPDEPTLQALAAAEARILHLERALVSNRRIGIALGILMCREQLTEDQAFDRLRALSQLQNRKLSHIADEVVYTGTA